MSATLLMSGWLACGLLAARLAATRETVARAAHEVRGPLTAAMLATHGLEGPQDRLGALGAQLESARWALDGLTGAGSTRREPVSAAALMAAVAEAWRPVAIAAGRRLEVAPAEAGPVVLGDRARIGRALGNLVANALEHGSGAVQVRCRPTVGWLRIEVSDEGPGLPASLGRLGRGPRTGRGARGRGLAIAAGIAADHGGRLIAAPSSEGATLVLELPLLPNLPACRAVEG